MRLVAQYESDDGRRFDTEAECRAHEARPPESRVVGLTAEQVALAMHGNDPALAEAFERVGNHCRDWRIAAGGSKRRRTAEPTLAITHQAAE